MIYQMRIKDIIDENFQDYKKTSMMIAMCFCDWKCMKELGFDCSICQNSSIINQRDYLVSVEDLFDRYKNNPLTSAIVIGGLEPFLQFNEVYNFIKYVRMNDCEDDIVIYTGYYPKEISDNIEQLKQFKNIVVKFGRFIPNSTQKYDEVLGVTLNSDNQYAERIS